MACVVMCSVTSDYEVRIEGYCVSYQQRETSISDIGFLVLIVVVSG